MRAVRTAIATATRRHPNLDAKRKQPTPRTAFDTTRGERVMIRHTPSANEVIVDRRRTGRRAANDRRRGATEAHPPVEQRSVATRSAENRPVEQRHSERRTKVERRRQIDPTTC